VFLTVSIYSPAQTRRDREPYCDDSLKRVEIADSDASIAGLSIGRSSLQDVQAKFGRAELVRVSQEEESDVSICYISPTDNTVIVFYSGAMGGWKDLDQRFPRSKPLGCNGRSVL
jgi:type IV secretory pathway VirJ component